MAAAPMGAMSIKVTEGSLSYRGLISMLTAPSAAPTRRCPIRLMCTAIWACPFCLDPTSICSQQRPASNIYSTVTDRRRAAPLDLDTYINGNFSRASAR